MGKSIIPGSVSNIKVGIEAINKNKKVPTTYITKILKPNYVKGVNTLEQWMLDEENIKYVIKYDFDLNGAEITVPEGCVLDFDGGSISNGTLTGTDTQIRADKVAIFTGITINGSWNVPYITSDWFGDAKTVDNTLKQAFNLCSDDVYNTLTVEKGDYWVAVLEENTGALQPSSNLCIELLGNIKLRGHNFSQGKVLYFISKNNISIVGSGAVYGDKLTHIYADGQTHPDGYVNPDGPTDEYTLPTHEQCHTIAFTGCVNVLIDGISIYNATGDGIDMYHSSLEYNNVIIRNFYIQGCRRQGITLGAVNGIVENGVIKGIRGTNPQSGIDIEINNNVDTHKSKRILIRNLAIDDCVKGIQVASYQDPPAEQDFIEVNNVEITNCHTGIICYSDVKQFTVRDSLVSVKYYSYNINRYSKNYALSIRAEKGDIYNCRLIGDSDSLPINTETGEKNHTYLVDCGGSAGNITLENCIVDAPDFYCIYHHSDMKIIGCKITCYGFLYPATITTLRTFYSNNVLTLNKGGLFLNANSLVYNNIITISEGGEFILQTNTVKANTITLHKGFIIRGTSFLENNDITFVADTTEEERYNCIVVEGNSSLKISNNCFRLLNGVVGNISCFISIISNRQENTPAFVTNNTFHLFDFDIIRLVGAFSSQSVVGLCFKGNFLNATPLPNTGTGEGNRLYNESTYTGSYSFVKKHSVAAIRSNTQPISLFKDSSIEPNKEVVTSVFALDHDIFFYTGEDVPNSSYIDITKVKYNGIVDFRYCANLSTELTPNKDVYLKFNYNSDTNLMSMITDGATYVQELPSAADTCAYVLFGRAVTGTHVIMADRQYKYIFVDGVLTLYDKHA